MHQNRASLFASDFLNRRRLGCRKELCNLRVSFFFLILIAATIAVRYRFLIARNRGSWALKSRAILRVSGKKMAGATAENRSIVVHSGRDLSN